MQKTTKKTRHIASRTVWLSVLSSVVVGLASLLVGLSIYGNSLMQESISRTRTMVSTASSSVRNGTDTIGLAGDVMRVYESLTDEQRRLTGTEEYRQHFDALESVSAHGQSYDKLIHILGNNISDGTRLYVCVFDEARSAMVYIAEAVGTEDPAYPGDWETVSAGWVKKLTDFPDYEWKVDNSPYEMRRSEDGGRLCVTAYPIRNDDGEDCAFLVAELSINSVVTKIVQYALKVSAVVLALTLLIAVFVGLRMKKTVADPINAIADMAKTYVQDRRSGVDRADHFASLDVRTGDELENLTNVMADMEQELIEHEDQIEALLDSLVKALSTAIDDRSHYTGKHTQNMVKMAEAFLDWMEAHGDPWQYDEIHRRVFIMSVGLHDIGKLTVPLEIMDKSTRLGPALGPVAERFARMRLLNRIGMLEGRVSEAEYLRRSVEAEQDMAFILRVNTAGYLSDEDLGRVKGLAERTFVDEDGTTQRLLTEDEIEMLSIRKGTLTAEERSRMQGHATSTWNILNQVDFPAQYAHIPTWASSHHELLQGSGYPNGVSGESISREVRLLTILDIFEALTAKDRPYKKSYSPDTAWGILENMVQDGSLDGELLAMFRESRAWETILAPEQGSDPGES